jgi:purine nucleoside permease
MARPLFPLLPPHNLFSAFRSLISASAKSSLPTPLTTPQFRPEAEIWYTNSNSTGSIGNLLAKNITVPGFSPLFPDAHCLADGSVCQLVTGESEINAAATISALVLSPFFDLKKTYFLIAGIAGINPKQATLASVAFPKYAVQVALQYEFDAREFPDGFNKGYVPQGSNNPNQYPQSIYGTEVFELNAALRDIAFNFASSASLNDSQKAQTYRARYSTSSLYQAATKSPGILKCDVATLRRILQRHPPLRSLRKHNQTLHQQLGHVLHDSPRR